MNLAHELFLLTAHLSQLRSQDHHIQLFIEGINDIFFGQEFAWLSEKGTGNNLQIPVSTRAKTYGIIVCRGESDFDAESFALLQNAIQMLAIALEKLEQDHFISDQQLHLQHLVAEKTRELTRFNNHMVGREVRMIALKEEVNELLKKMGEPEKYKISCSLPT
jgi:hypothetical protein